MKWTFGAVTLCCALIAIGNASALTREQAREECRSSAGRPVFRACMQRGGSPEACKEEARPNVQRCVRGKMASAGSAGSQVAGPRRGDRQFERWCRRPVGVHAGETKFNMKEAAGCFRR